MMGSVKDKGKFSDECGAVLERNPPRFAILYSDGSMVMDDGIDVEVTFKVPRAWLDAPKDGVLHVIKHRYDGSLIVFYSVDFYCVMEDGELFATNDTSTLLRRLGICKSGINVPDEEFEAARERVQVYRREHEAKKKA
jgi:hypothetical protein